MSVVVSFGGISYSVPEEDDSGWADLTAYLVALSAASVGSQDNKSQRVATATPVNLSATEDYSVGVNVASVSSVVLPAGVSGQIFVVFDASGAAATNKITISGTGGQLINGRADYVIQSNFGAVQVQFGTSGWNILSAKVTTSEQNTTNLSMIDAELSANNTGVNVLNLESCTFTFIGKNSRFIVEAGTQSFECACSSGSNIVNALWDTSSLFLPTDSGTGVVVTKSGQVVTVKNRTGSTINSFKIKVVVGGVASATAWS